MITASSQYISTQNETVAWFLLWALSSGEYSYVDSLPFVKFKKKKKKNSDVDGDRQIWHHVPRDYTAL